MVKLQADKIVLPGSTGVYEIYNLMLTRLGFPNQAGHTMAAAVLARCIVDATVVDHVMVFNDMMKAMTLSKSAVISGGTRALTPQMTYTAATLTCKRAGRTPGQMLTNLELAYAGLVADGWVPALHNVVAAADLLQ